MNELEHEKYRLEKLLAESTKIIQGDYVLYVANDEVMKEIFLFKKEIDLHFKDEFNKNPFSTIGKILNEEHPAISYYVKNKHVRVEIFDREKIKKDIPKRIKIWENSQKKHQAENVLGADEMIEEKDFSKIKERIKENVEDEVNLAYHILENIEDYEVVITNYERKLQYPYCFYSYLKRIKNGTKKQHEQSILRKNVCNILWFREQNGEIQDPRNKILDIVRNYNRVCDMIYYKKIQ